MSSRPGYGTGPSRTALAVGLGILLGLGGVGLAINFSARDPAPPPPTCLGSDSGVADRSAPHGAFVLDPPNGPHNAYYSDVQSYLLRNPALCGADYWVAWSSVTNGTAGHLTYNFSAVDAHAASWIAAGKEVNLVFQIFSGPSDYVPGSLLSEIPTVQCGNSAVTPVEWNGTFETAYRGFIATAVHHFETEPGFGYLRFDLGVPGELAPVSDIDAPGCQSELASDGFSLASWANYLDGMLSFEHSLDPTIQLLVPISPVFPGEGDNISATVSKLAASDGIGLGTEGLRMNESAAADPDGVGCREDVWCQQFSMYQGEVPLQVQTTAASSPNGSGPVGSLPSLLTVGLTVNAQIFELYLDDWLTAFDPNYPPYAEYHVQYAAALNSLASVVGTY